MEVCGGGVFANFLFWAIHGLTIAGQGRCASSGLDEYDVHIQYLYRYMTLTVYIVIGDAAACFSDKDSLVLRDERAHNLVEARRKRRFQTFDHVGR